MLPVPLDSGASERPKYEALSSRQEDHAVQLIETRSMARHLDRA